MKRWRDLYIYIYIYRERERERWGRRRIVVVLDSEELFCRIHRRPEEMKKSM
jgi:hypothetical protein